MSQRTPRRRAPVIGVRRSKPPYPSPSSRQRTNKSKPIRILKRCSSAPVLLPDDDDIDRQYSRTEGTLFRPQTFSDAFVSSPSLFAFSPQSRSNEIQGYDKEAKVVFNVTVEGSTGPVRTMAKLGCSVEETIRLVVDKYREEGRSPKLDPNGASSFKLHHSYFSLQSLDKSEVIGDVGSRSFYLRKTIGASALSSFRSESVNELATHRLAPSIPPPPFLLPSFVARKISKIVRRAHRLWNIVVCSQ